MGLYFALAASINPIRFVDPDGRGPNGCGGLPMPVEFMVFLTAAKYKAEKVMNHIFDTASKMEKPQKTTRGKDVIRLGTGVAKGKDKITKTKYEIGMTVAFNTDKGIVVGLEASGEMANVQGEVSVKGHATGENNNGVEVEAALKQKSGVPEPTEEISAGNGITVAVNPKCVFQ